MNSNLFKISQIQAWTILALSLILGLMAYLSQGIGSKIFAFFVGIFIYSLPKMLFMLLNFSVIPKEADPKQICHMFYRAALIKWFATLVGFGWAFSNSDLQAIFVIYGFSFMALILDFALITQMSPK